MSSGDLLNIAVEAAIAPGPISEGHTMLILTEAERKSLLELLPAEGSGPLGSARLKLRSAAPVRDAGWKRDHFRGLLRWASRLFETDGRERGRCRWCHARTRIDQYGLCPSCVPPHAQAINCR
jgi:hypothetical protein